MKRAMAINAKDNTATVFDQITAGDAVTLLSASGEIGQIIARGNVPFGHKIALTQINQGEKVLKYGEVIGLATRPINPGEHVHVHNVASALLPGRKAK